jgi:hypothetical protein
MSSLRFAAVLLIALALAPSAGASTRASAAGATLRAPRGLHAFLLRPNEPATTAFARTPSFGWNPVAGAKRYQFVLSTSPLFASSGLVWDDSTLTGPAASVPVMLPWITGDPHSLYARVRAIGARNVTSPWSASFGFDMRWPNIPQPLPAPNGMVRWTTVDGATGYQVWFTNIDVGGGKSKIFATTTNVADEREYYTFHRSAAYTSTVLWRVRAVRRKQDTQGPANGLPYVSYGPWSPVYQSFNTPPTSGPLTPTGTISDVDATDGTPAAHRLMPAFVFSGDYGRNSTPAELFRIYVFTDSDCLNRVFRSAIIGGPAYAPRTTGPLALPADTAKLNGARTTFLADGGEGTSQTFDGEPITSTEADSPSTFTPTLVTPGGSSSSGSGSSGSGSGSGSSGSSGSAAPDPKKPFPASLASDGAPIDLWDTNWPTGRYFWTIVPVWPVTTTGLPAAPNAAVPIQYVDGELAQESCASGRVATFGKTSEPVLTSAGTPFASGLSPTGRLLSAATGNPLFYGTPLVAWMPALGATAYEVAWSKKLYPWKTEANQYTFATSATLPLTPGTWYYRVRGIDLSLPQGAQQMAWSDPVRVRVARPKFKVSAGK